MVDKLCAAMASRWSPLALRLLLVASAALVVVVTADSLENQQQQQKATIGTLICIRLFCAGFW